MKTILFLLLGALTVSTRLASAADTNSPTTAESALEALTAGFSGKVVDTTNASGYTYVQVDTGTQKVWAAATVFEVKVGDAVVVGQSSPMGTFHSKSLNRDFENMFFASQIAVNGTGAGAAPKLPPGHPAIPGASTPSTPVLPPGHPSLTAAPAAPNLDLTGIKKADGGKTVQEIIVGKAKLTGKTVSVRGKVVKYNAMILGKNWLHIRDGSGSADNGDNDLTITTSTPAKLGDTVLVTGNVATDRDFGAGYKYAVIIEDGKVTVE